MKKDEVLGIVRHVLTFLGAILASKGVAESADTEAIAGGLLAVLAGAWSIYDKRKRGGGGPSTPTAPPMAPAACVALLGALVFAGCASTMFKTVSVAEATVDKAMIAWCDYCAWQEQQPGYDAAALLRAEGKVSTAYGTYRSAMNAFYDIRHAFAKNQATAGEYDAAVKAWKDAAQALIVLINQLAVR